MNKLARRGSLLPDSIFVEFSDMLDRFNNITSLLEGDDFFSDFFKPVRGLRRASKPKIDVKEDETSYEIVADVAGLTKDDIKLEVFDNYIVLEGEKKESTKEGEGDPEDGSWIYKELSYRKFRRAIPLGCEIQGEKAEADLKDGLLVIKLPKKETKPKALPVDIKVNS